MSLKVIGVGASPFVRKVRVALAEKNVPYEHEPLVPLNVPPEHKKMHPLGKIPVLRDGDKVIPDSSAILVYLEHLHPEPALSPSDPYDHARAVWLEELADDGLVPASAPYFREKLLARAFFQREPDEEVARKAIEEDLPPLLDYLEEQLGDQQFFVGGRFTVADVAIASPLVNLHHAGWSPDAKKHPKLAAWLERTLSRPSFKALIEEEKSFFSGS